MVAQRLAMERGLDWPAGVAELATDLESSYDQLIAQETAG